MSCVTLRVYFIERSTKFEEKIKRKFMSMNSNIEPGYGILRIDSLLMALDGDGYSMVITPLVSKFMNCQRLTSNTPAPKAKNPIKRDAERVKFDGVILASKVL